MLNLSLRLLPPPIEIIKRGDTMNYDSRIDAQYQSIASKQQEIAELREKTEQLQQARRKVDDVNDALKRAAQQSSGRLSNPSGIFGAVKTMIRSTFFSPLMDLITGVRYRSALNTLDNIRDQIEQKIREMKNRVEQLEMEIQDCYRSIDHLKAEKAAEIKREKERHEREAAEAAVSNC